MSSTQPAAGGATAGGAAAGPVQRHLGLALVVIATAQLMVVLDATIVNVALPDIQKALGFSGTGLEWVTPHTFRKTIATVIAERLGAEAAAAQLSHSSATITREFYIAKPAIDPDIMYASPPTTAATKGSRHARRNR